MTDYGYGAVGDNAIICICEGISSELPNTAAGYDYMFIQCESVSIDGKRLSNTKYLPSRLSYNTRTAKKSHSVAFTGIVTKKDATSIVNDVATIAKLLDVNKGLVAPYYCFVKLVDGGTSVYYPFSDTAGSFKNYLKGYLDSDSMKIERGKRFKLTATFGECQS